MSNIKPEFTFSPRPRVMIFSVQLFGWICLPAGPPRRCDLIGSWRFLSFCWCFLTNKHLRYKKQMSIETAAAGKQIHPYIDELCCRLPIQEAPLDGWSRTRSPFGSFFLFSCLLSFFPGFLSAFLILSQFHTCCNQIVAFLFHLLSDFSHFLVLFEVIFGHSC